MRAAAVALAAVALAVPAACGSSSHDSKGTWSQAAAGLHARLDPGSENLCQRGDLACLDLVLAEMRKRDATLAAACDHRALFTRMYLRTTEALRSAVGAGRFRDGPAIVHFAAWFARLGFEAEDRGASGQIERVPPAWRVAFSAEAARRVRSIGDLLLSMNAHISRDLAFTVADLERGPGTKIDRDFVLFTNVIEARSASIIADLAQRFDPALALAEVPFALGGERTVGGLIGVWRTEAWRNGIALRTTHGDARASEMQRVEQLAALRAESIAAATAYVPVLQSSRSRDAYCTAHARS
jgi:Family of unknown function (DUF5995)